MGIEAYWFDRIADNCNMLSHQTIKTSTKKALNAGCVGRRGRGWAGAGQGWLRRPSTVNWFLLSLRLVGGMGGRKGVASASCFCFSSKVCNNGVHFTAVEVIMNTKLKE